MLFRSVQAIGLFQTELLTADGEPLYLPNGLFTHSAVVNGSRRPHRRLVLEVGLLLERREQAEAIVADLRHWLAGNPLVHPDLPRRVAFTALTDGALRLRVECAHQGELEEFHALRQDLLLEVNDTVLRQGGTLAPTMESSALKSAPAGGGRP